MLLSQEDTVPWHRQPLVWMIISIPLSAVMVCIVLLYLAITTDDGLVADDYYKQGMAINRLIARDEAARQLQLSAEMQIDIVEGFIKARFHKGLMEAFPARLRLALRHTAAQHRDKVIILQHGIDDAYVGAIVRDNKENDKTGIHPGMWYVVLTNTVDENTDEWRISRRLWLEGETRVRLQTR